MLDGLIVVASLALVALPALLNARELWLDRQNSRDHSASRRAIRRAWKARAHGR